MDTHTLIITKTFSAPREKVFAAWTGAAEVAQWYGPEGFVNTVHAFDCTVGGAYRISMAAPDGSAHTVVGAFTKIEKPSLLAMTWQWEGSNEQTTVEVTLKESAGGTVMTLTHRGFATATDKDNHNAGWTGSFAKLLKLVG